jgi:hypothetical protein
MRCDNNKCQALPHHPGEEHVSHVTRITISAFSGQYHVGGLCIDHVGKEPVNLSPRVSGPLRTGSSKVAIQPPAAHAPCHRLPFATAPTAEVDHKVDPALFQVSNISPSSARLTALQALRANDGRGKWTSITSEVSADPLWFGLLNPPTAPVGVH